MWSFYYYYYKEQIVSGTKPPAKRETLLHFSDPKVSKNHDGGDWSDV
jgi:hypothetical protein